MATLPKLTVQTIAGHNRPDDLWLVVDGVVYDLTEFAPHHPGGTAILHRFAGADASRAYAAVHAPSLIGATLDARHHRGVVDDTSITPQWRAAAASADTDADEGDEAARPPLASILNLDDFEAAARAALPPQAFAYIASGSNDNLTRDANQALLRRIWLRPAVLRNVAAARLDLRATLFGGRVRLRVPVYVAPTGATRTAGPEGELAVVRGAVAAGMVPMISTVASYPYSEILAQLPATDDDPNHNACTGDGGVFFQLYVDRDRRRTARLLYDLLGSERGRHNVRAIFVTVDLPVVSKREGDERARAARTARAAQRNAEKEPAGKDKQQQTQAPVRGGIAKQTGAFIDPSFAWEDLKWLRTVVDGAMAGGKQQPGEQPLPIVVKGIQRADDARRALAMGCQGIVLSNHGGRAADSAPPAILTLLELHRCCPEVFGRLEIFVDGGFRRGSDVVKAICLGASAVGVGRPFIYSVGYGQAGVDHAAAILEDEIQTAMQLCGVTHLMRDAHPDFVNTGDVDHLVSGNTHPYARKPVWPAKL